jgi:hypothetical protein
MIPPEPGAKANRSERALFTAFEGILERSDWVVIHSLAIGRHQAGLSGERVGLSDFALTSARS